MLAWSFFAKVTYLRFFDNILKIIVYENKIPAII